MMSVLCGLKAHSHNVRLMCASAADLCVAVKNRKSSNYFTLQQCASAADLCVAVINRKSSIYSHCNSVRVQQTCALPKKIEKVLIIHTATVCRSRMQICSQFAAV